MTEEAEFGKIYNLPVTAIPTNKPDIRNNEPDAIFNKQVTKYKEVVEEIVKMSKIGRPVLVGTISIEKSELISALLKQVGVKHNVLNAKHHQKEAYIIAQAGRVGAVTIATNMAGEKGKPVYDFLVSANEIVGNIVKIIMYFAPVGLGCYFAALVGSFGASIAVGYLKTFVIYTIVAIAFYFIVYTIYAFIAGGKKGIVAFWKNAIPSTLTALATCSSAASIPVNVECAKKMGVPDDIAETTIPLGTSFHKDGSIIGSVFKIMFLVCLFGTSLATPGSVLGVVGVALLANLLITAVPIGGGTISEMLIITMLGYPVAALPILTIIATIIDPPATMLNVVGDTVSSMMVTRVVDGKDWLDK